MSGRASEVPCVCSEEILRNCEFFRGKYRYEWGGTGKNGGIDCSHLVFSILQGAGYRIPYQTTSKMDEDLHYHVLRQSEVRPGDLILWKEHHVGIVETVGLPECSVGGTFFSATSHGVRTLKFHPRCYWKTATHFLRPRYKYYHGRQNTQVAESIAVASVSDAAEPEISDAEKEARMIASIDDSYFPVGVNLTWHGGIHWPGLAGGGICCLMDGEVVAARLPANDPAPLSHGSRNFVLVQHRSPKGNRFWSLYMHLQPRKLDEDGAAVFPWLYDWTLSVTGTGESNLRPLPSLHAAPLRGIRSDETFAVMDRQEVDGFTWLHVRSQQDGTEGWVAKTARVRLRPVLHEREALQAGKVVRFCHPVRARQLLGYFPSALPGRSSFIHYEIFSERPVEGGWREFRDHAADDMVCDADGLLRLFNTTDREGPHFVEEGASQSVQAAYSDKKRLAVIWDGAYFFRSEWALNWEEALVRFDPGAARRQGPSFNIYRFWAEAETAGCDLPPGGDVYHYHPLVFLDKVLRLKDPELEEAPPPEPVPPGRKGWLRTSEDGIKMIKESEGFKSKPYDDSAGHATIGYGTLLHRGRVTAADERKYGRGMAEAEADIQLRSAVANMEKSLNRCVKVKLNQNQFDALMDWLYNFGSGSLKKSTWLKLLNQGLYDRVPGELRKWNKETKKGRRIPNQGLTARREREARLFQGLK